MNALREARKRLFERHWYGRAESDDYIERTFREFNNLPPTRTKFCDRCGAEVRWYRETPSFSVKTGRPGHSYLLKCPHLRDVQRALAELSIEPLALRARMAVLEADRHYDSHEYRFVEDDRLSFDQEDLW